ncbi:MAG: 3-methyl-2-oxobutanoate hydroxymethyltransferase, partial [Nitrososphaera sp.]|nr:3-methyl-2-oxobutanoate hydroxymethyltransferase [Nitrososphaera sp.]
MNVNDILAKKGKERISVLTAYEYSTARICDSAGIDIILVGDSAGMVVLGYTSTMPVSMQEM